MRRIPTIIFILLLQTFNACQQPQKKQAGSDTGRVEISADSLWKSQLLTMRKQKDDAFAMSNTSPFHDLPGDFTGLKYFPVNPKWRFQALWMSDVKPETAKIRDTKGQMRDYVYAGILNFEVDGAKYHIPAYFEDLERKIMFVMFRDLTNGKSTYGGGRYLEFRIPEDKKIILDFNQAYNPFCHYNHRYSCPVVPEGHKLALEITAGEMKYGE